MPTDENHAGHGIGLRDVKLTLPNPVFRGEVAGDERTIRHTPPKEERPFLMNSPVNVVSTAPLACRVGEDADVAQIAEAVRAVWTEIEEALSPIIGKRGVAALYRRSVHLSRGVHPWLAGPPEGIDAAMDTQPLLAALVLRNRADALLASAALFQNFHDLLASLVGPSLTERLLRPVWTVSAGTPPATESSTS